MTNERIVEIIDLVMFYNDIPRSDKKKFDDYANAYLKENREVMDLYDKTEQGLKNLLKPIAESYKKREDFNKDVQDVLDVGL